MNCLAIASWQETYVNLLLQYSIYRSTASVNIKTIIPLQTKKHSEIYLSHNFSKSLAMVLQNCMHVMIQSSGIATELVGHS